MPDSKSDAERDKLKVTMHWYGFQTLTIRSTCSFPVWAWQIPRRSVQRARSASNASATTAGCRYLSIVGRTSRLSIVCDPGGSNFASGGVLCVAEKKDDFLRLPRAELEADVV